MDWTALAKILAARGAPMLAESLGVILPFPANLAAKIALQALAAAFGASPDDPAAIQKAIETDPNADAKIHAVETAHAQDLQSALDFAKLQVDQNNAALEYSKTLAWPLKIFFAGWRPAFGWVCVLGVIYILIADVAAWPTVKIETWNPIWVVFGWSMGLRSVDKFFGTASGVVGGIVRRKK